MRRWRLATLLALLTLAAALPAAVMRGSTTGQGLGTAGPTNGVAMSTTGSYGYDDTRRLVASGAFTAEPASGGTLAATSASRSIAEPMVNGYGHVGHCYAYDRPTPDGRRVAAQPASLARVRAAVSPTWLTGAQFHLSDLAAEAAAGDGLPAIKPGSSGGPSAGKPFS